MGRNSRQYTKKVIKIQMKSHNEFMEDVKHASSLPSQTSRALAPVTDEDINIYALQKDGE